MHYQESKNFTHSLYNFKYHNLEFAQPQKSVQKQNHSVFEMENQECLQQKILTLFDLIEQKTIMNIEIKNENEILQAKIDAYMAIITKMQTVSSNTTFRHGSKRQSGNHQKVCFQANLSNQIKKTYVDQNFDKTTLQCFQLPLESKNFVKNQKNNSIFKNKTLNFEDVRTGKQKIEQEKSSSKKSENSIFNNTKPSLFYLSNLKEPDYFSKENYKSSKKVNRKSSSSSNLLSKRYSEIDIDKLWDNTKICKTKFFVEGKNEQKDELKKRTFFEMNKESVVKNSKR